MNNDGNPDFKDSKHKAKFHGEETRYVEWGVVNDSGRITNWNAHKNAAQNAAGGVGKQLIRRVVIESRWEEVDA